MKPTEALPIQGRGVLLRTSFNQSLIESFKYLLGLCVEVIPPDLFKEVNEKLISLNPTLKLSGLLSIIHTDFFNAADQHNIQKVNEIVKELVKTNFQIEEIKYLNLSHLGDYYSPLVKFTFSQETLENVKFLPLSSQSFEKVKESFHRGFEILKRSLPEIYGESQELISEVLILNAEGLKAGSSLDLFGMIYVSYLYKWEKITEVLDLITHEQSHLYIHLLNKDDPIVLNPNERYESPLRKEKRPLMGIYHATFVLARIVYVLKKSLRLGEIPENEKSYCRELIAYYEKRCRVGLEILQKYAQMTPLGSQLIHSAGLLLTI